MEEELKKKDEQFKAGAEVSKNFYLGSGGPGAGAAGKEKNSGPYLDTFNMKVIEAELVSN